METKESVYKKCVLCEREFNPNHHLQKFCTKECSEKFKREICLKNYYAHREKYLQLAKNRRLKNHNFDKEYYKNRPWLSHHISAHSMVVVYSKKCTLPDHGDR